MSAAFLGNIVEKDIHKSSLIAAICFAAGMAGTGFFIYYGGTHKGSTLVLVGIYLCYGFIMGVGLGTGYLSPVKTLMLWFKDRKGLATGLAVAGFGAAKAIASRIMKSLLESLGETGIYKMFFILAAVYFVMMFISNPDAEILKYAQQVLDISAIFFIPLGLIFIYRNALQGIGDSFVPMMAGAYELIARAIVAFTLPRYLGFMGICLADPVAWFAAVIPLGITYFKRIRSLLKHGNIKV